MSGKAVSLVAVVGLWISGCRSDPYCLTCQDGSGGDGGNVTGDAGGDDGGSMFDLAQPDIISAGDGGCVPSNGGVEKCDGIDNDCNGTIDDVDPAKLAADPNNCGMCGNVCSFNALHRFGGCIGGGDLGAPHCAPATCEPGFVALGASDKTCATGCSDTTACDYQCTPTANPAEICDGKDNDCNGKIDDPFTTTYDTAGKPNYDSDAANCGACGFPCNLPNAVTACQAGPTGTGVCVVDHCINQPGVATYRHNPAAGNINTTGCEYQCPIATTTVTTGSQDCDSVACVFPQEQCNALDDNCDFIVDNPPFDVIEGIGSACADKCPGGLVANCVGACTAGTVMCNGGVKQCIGSTGPTAEVCDGIDNDCNGKIDDPFTATYAGTAPKYDSDPRNCGACGTNCGLAHAVNGCQLSGPKGQCVVLQCNAGFNYAPQNGCGNPPPGPRDGATGVGCYYTCPVNPTAPEVCDGKDNDCNGCADDGLTQPANFCANKGVCLGQTIPVVCNGAAGWKCNYSGVPNIELDVNGNLPTLESKCDGFDGNCNGTIDRDGFSTLGNACSAGTGVCQVSGTIKCDPGNVAVANCRDAGNALVTANLAARTDELCDGKDNDCDGLVDERTDTVIGATTYKGWRDAMTQVGAVYVYQYESSRPDALLASPGGNSSRACSKPGVLPWANVTETQAAAACAAVRDSANVPMRLCTAAEWQTACQGNTAPVPTQSYSFSPGAPGPGVYQPKVCNDANNGPVLAVWATGHDNLQANKCYAQLFGSVPTDTTKRLFDMSGNLMEWTSTTLTVGATTYFKIRGGAYTSPADGVPPDGVQCEFDFVIAQASFANADVGFRCCANNAP